jgi:uncharacterized DUF497 family protein
LGKGRHCVAADYGGAGLARGVEEVQRDTLHIQLAVRCEWDENKNRANVAKHGLSFTDVAPVFGDPLALTIPDRVTDGEQRYRTVGTAASGVVLVAHTLREVSGGDELVRIISARFATLRERKEYEEGDY